MGTIKFYAGDENHIVIEKKDFRNSLFSNEYSEALALTEAIYLKNLECINAKNEEEEYATSGPNAIVFCGDRGEGKTSCMMTVQNMIKNSGEEHIKNYLDEQVSRQFDPSSILCLNIIDPAHFDTNHNILELVLGQLYRNFKQEHAKRAAHHNAVEFNQTAVLFSEVKRCLSDLIKKEEKIYDELEELDCLSASMALGQSLSKLLKSYLHLLNKKQLLICIDDLDYNIVDAHKMVKQISTYLHSPHCILYITVKMQQLSTLIQNKLERQINAQESLDIHQLTSKFIQKLFPISHRVEIPRVSTYYDTPVEIYSGTPDQKGKLIVRDSLKHIIPKLISKKTGYQFYHNKEHYSPIIPRDLRGLRQMVGMLVNMRDAEKRAKSNKRIFRNYFFNEWIRCLNKEDELFVRKLVNEENLSKINHIVTNQLINRYRQHFPAKVGSGEVALDDYLSYYSHNVSIGDALYFVSYVERHCIDEYTHRLVFFIKAFYSILLCDNDDAILERHPYAEVETVHSTYINSAWYSETNSLQRLVNGEYFNFKNERLIPFVHQGQKMDWSETAIGGLFLAHLYRVKKQIDDGYEELDESKKEAFRKDFVMLEYFMLCIKGELLTADYNNTGRIKASSYPYFLSTFKMNTQYFLFDVMGVFNSMINIKFAYDRFKKIKDFYSFAIAHNWTLISQMAGSTALSRLHSKRISSSIMPHSALRNAEVIIALRDHAVSIGNTIPGSNDVKSSIIQLYKGLINSGITAEGGSDGTKQEYKFLDIICGIIDEFDSDHFNSIFTELFSDKGIEQNRLS